MIGSYDGDDSGGEGGGVSGLDGGEGDGGGWREALHGPDEVHAGRGGGVGGGVEEGAVGIAGDVEEFGYVCGIGGVDGSSPGEDVLRG